MIYYDKNRNTFRIVSPYYDYVVCWVRYPSVSAGKNNAHSKPFPDKTAIRPVNWTLYGGIVLFLTILAVTAILLFKDSGE